MLVIVTGVREDVFLTVVEREELVVPTVTLPKFTTVGVNVTVPDCAIPLPFRVRVCEPCGVLSVAMTEAVRDPTACGVKVTVTMQEAPGASVFGVSGQLLAWV